MVWLAGSMSASGYRSRRRGAGFPIRPRILPSVRHSNRMPPLESLFGCATRSEGIGRRFCFASEYQISPVRGEDWKIDVRFPFLRPNAPPGFFQGPSQMQSVLPKGPTGRPRTSRVVSRLEFPRVHPELCWWVACRPIDPRSSIELIDSTDTRGLSMRILSCEMSDFCIPGEVGPNKSASFRWGSPSGPRTDASGPSTKRSVNRGPNASAKSSSPVADHVASKGSDRQAGVI